METTKWICPNCQEVLEATFDNCWNCSSDRLGILDPKMKQEHKEIKVAVQKEMAISDTEMVMVNKSSILKVAASFRTIVQLSIISTVSIFFILIAQIADLGSDISVGLSYLAILLVIIMYILIISSIFSIAEQLEFSVSQHERNKQHGFNDRKKGLFGPSIPKVK